MFYVVDDKGNEAIVIASNMGYGLGISASIPILVFPNMPSVNDFIYGKSVNLGLKIDGIGGVCIAEINNKEYVGIYISIGLGVEVDVDASIGLRCEVLWKNY